MRKTAVTEIGVSNVLQTNVSQEITSPQSPTWHLPAVNVWNGGSKVMHVLTLKGDRPVLRAALLCLWSYGGFQSCRRYLFPEWNSPVFEHNLFFPLITPAQMIRENILLTGLPTYAQRHPSCIGLELHFRIQCVGRFRTSLPGLLDSLVYSIRDIALRCIWTLGATRVSHPVHMLWEGLSWQWAPGTVCRSVSGAVFAWRCPDIFLCGTACVNWFSYHIQVGRVSLWMSS